jgi:hypothetical protein
MCVELILGGSREFAVATAPESVRRGDAVCASATVLARLTAPGAAFSKNSTRGASTDARVIHFGFEREQGSLIGGHWLREGQRQGGRESGRGSSWLVDGLSCRHLNCDNGDQLLCERGQGDFLESR